MIARTRAAERVARALTQRLTVVYAPAGYGKSTAVFHALAGTPNVTWYVARPWHADSFVSPIVGAIRRVRPDFGRNVLASAQRRAGSTLGAIFAADLTHVDAVLTVVIDDAHHVAQSGSFAEFFDGFFPHAPQGVRVVFVSQSIPMNALRELAEPRAAAFVTIDDLWLQPDEAVALAQARGATLSVNDAHELCARTDGRIAAAHLELAFGAAPVTDPIAYDALLAAHVLAQLPHAQQDGLLRLAPVADVEPTAIDAHAPVDRLVSDGVLVRAVMPPERLAVNPVLRTALLDTLTRDPRRSAIVHAVALAHEQAGNTGAALYYAHASHDAPVLREMLARCGDDAVAAGFQAAVARLVSELRTRLDARDPLLCYLDGVIEHAHGEPRARLALETAVTAARERGEAAIEFAAHTRLVEYDLGQGLLVDYATIEALHQDARDRGPAAELTVAMLAAWRHAIAGEFDAALTLTEALVHVPDARAASGAAIVRAYALTSAGRFDDARHCIDRAIAELEQGDRIVITVQALIWHARFALVWGDAVTALDFATIAQRIAAHLELEAESAALYAALAEAHLHAAQARACADAAAQIRRNAPRAWYAVDRERLAATADIFTARALFIGGDRANALAFAESIATGETVPSTQRAVSLADAALYAFVAGSERYLHLDARARSYAQRAHVHDAADAAALQDAFAVLDTIAAATEGTHATTTVRDERFTRLTTARTSASHLPLIGLALREALHDGIFAPIAAALELAAQRGPRFELFAVLAVCEHVARSRPQRLAAFREAAAPARRLFTPTGASERGAGTLVVPLTERETEVLHLLARGLTNKEIAQQLVLSPRTIETHVERVLGKLEASSRSHAIAKAARLGLVTVA